MAHDIYISYSDNDKLTAEAVCAGLEEKGLRCWYAARDVQKGEDPTEAREQAIDDSKIMVLVFSDNANGSPLVVREVCSAADSRKRIVPFRIAETEPSDNLKYYLGGTHWLDAAGKDLKRTIASLAAECERELRGQPKPAGKPRLLIIAAVAILAVALIAVSGKLFGGKDTEPAEQTDTQTETQTETETEEPSADAQVKCMLGGMTCEEFKSRFNSELESSGADISQLDVTIYDADGNEADDSSEVSSVEMLLPKDKASSASYESLYPCVRALIAATFDGDDDWTDRMAYSMMGAYDSTQLSINDVIDGHKLFCNFTPDGGKMVVEPF